MENKKPKLPIKLPPNERKKLTLLLDTSNQTKKAYEEEEEISKNNDLTINDEGAQTKSDEDNRFSNDNNAYFIEKVDECDLTNESLTDESSINDSNSYYALNEFISKDVSTISEISNPTPNEPISEDEDEDKFIVPCGLIPEPEAITPSSDEAPMFSNPAPNNKPAHPTLPKKMSKKEFQNSFRRTISLANSTNHEDDESNYCRPSKLALTTFKSFKDEIHRHNKLCADCQTNTSSYLSCKYFLTLCEQCAEIHQKLPHHVNKFYTIEFAALYDELKKSITDVSIDSFLEILAEAGNEKMNSLFEFESMQSKRAVNIVDFIKEKYLNKSFLNLHEIHYTSNYIDISNQTFSLQGLCIPIIIYNLFIGANINYSNAAKTAFDTACELNENTPQQNYFKLNNALAFSEIDKSILEQEFQGELLQVMDMNPTIQSVSIVNALRKHPIRLNLNKTSLRLIKNKAKTDINYLSLIKIESHLKLNLIEVKWCNKSNNSLMSTYFEYASENEKNIWMCELYFKLLAQLNLASLFEESKQSFLNLLDLIRACQINLIGYLNLNKYELIESDHEEGKTVVAILVETLEAQKHEFFQRKLILIDSTCEINQIDLRKIRIKLKDNLLRVDYENKCFVLRSFGYLQHLKTWHDMIVAKSEMHNTCINDQYLSRENVPVFVEKLCSFVEFNYVLEKQYYSLANLNKPQKQFKLDLNVNDLAAENIMHLFKLYFFDYFTTDHSALFIKSFGKFFDQSVRQPLRDYLTSVDFNKNKISFSSLLQRKESTTTSESDLNLVNLEKLKTFLFKLSQTNSTFYYTLRRMAIHLYLISSYKEKNQMKEEYLSQLFAPVMFSTANLSGLLGQSLESLKLNVSFTNENVLVFLFAKLLEAMIVNCTYLFNLKEQYLSTQLKMIERSFELNKINLSKQPPEANSKYLITIYYESKSSDKAYHLKIDSETTVDSLIDSIQDLKEIRNNLDLFEIFDNEQYKALTSRLRATSKLDDISLVRLLPSNLRILNNLSKWNSFYLCFKQSETKSLETFSLSENNHEKCEFIIQCKNCGVFSLNENSCGDCSSHKWRHCYLVVKNDTIRIYKRNQNENLTHSHQQEDYLKLKQLVELKLEDLMLYYGLYYWSDTASSSSTRISSFFPNEIKIADNECVSLFDKRSNLLYSIHFKDNTTCLSLYKDLYEKLYQQSCSQLSLFCNVTRYVSIWPSDSAFSTNSISRMFRKIIKK